MSFDPVRMTFEGMSWSHSNNGGISKAIPLNDVLGWRRAIDATVGPDRYEAQRDGVFTIVSINADVVAELKASGIKIFMRPNLPTKQVGDAVLNRTSRSRIPMAVAGSPEW